MNLNYTIIILGVILAIIFLAKDRYFEGKVPSWLFFLIIILLLFIAMINIHITKQGEKKEKYTSNVGKIEFPKSKLEKFPVIIYGGNKLVNSPISAINLDIPLEIWIGDNKNLMVNLTLFNSNLKPLAKINNNNWEINPSQGAWRKNFDKTAFEIIDDNDDVVFQIEFVNQTTLYIQGKFYNRQGVFVYVGTDKIIYNNPTNKEGLIIPKIFKYPTGMYPGERN